MQMDIEITRHLCCKYSPPMFFFSNNIYPWSWCSRGAIEGNMQRSIVNAKTPIGHIQLFTHLMDSLSL